MQCMAQDCYMNVEELLVWMDDDQKKVALCPNHSVAYVDNIFAHEQLSYLPSTVQQELKCELCGEHGILYNDRETTFHLCASHLLKLNRLCLSPDEFHILYECLGNVFVLHDDFYQPETGIALQPMN